MVTSYLLSSLLNDNTYVLYISLFSSLIIVNYFLALIIQMLKPTIFARNNSGLF